ncbi:hypothetical protein KJZ99_00195 [bacterium]|nr:hypothetical protein [bacterium]
MHDVWGKLADHWAHCLQQEFDSVLIDGQTIQQKYGITAESCKRFKVGYVPATENTFNIIQQLTGLRTDEIIAADYFGLCSAGSVGIYSFFSGRVVFPYLINNSVRYWSGRKTDAVANTSAPKFLHMKMDVAKIDERPFYLEPEYNNLCFVVEGHTHALLLQQHGFPAIAIGAKLWNTYQRGILRKLSSPIWIPDADVLKPSQGGLTTLADGTQKFIPGKSAADKIFELLPHMAQLSNLKILVYPQDFLATYGKGDICDWFKTHEPKHLIEWIDRALDFNDLAERAFEEVPSATELTNRIDDLARIVSHRSELVNRNLIDRIRKKTGQGAVISNEFTRIAKQASKSSRGEASETDQLNAALFTTIRPGQSFQNGMLYYTVWRSTTRTRVENGQKLSVIVDTPYLVTSKQDYFAAESTEMHTRSLRFPNNTEPSMIGFRWSTEPRDKFSVSQWLEHGVDDAPDGFSLFADTQNFIKRFVFFADKEIYSFLSLYSIYTYCYSVFPATGYIGITGTPGSGKSTVLQILTSLCFNTQPVASTSLSSLFHVTDEAGVTLAFDEAEKYHSQAVVNDTVDEQILAVYSGYKEGTPILRQVPIDGKRMITKAFEVYGPKIFSNTKGYNTTLLSRMILLYAQMCPSDVIIENFQEKQEAQSTRELRNRMYYWAIAHAPQVRSIYEKLHEDRSILKSLGLNNREAEIWGNFLAVAIALDFSSGNTYPLKTDDEDELNIPTSVLKFTIDACKKLTRAKIRSMVEKDTFGIFLAGLRQMVKTGDVQPISFDDRPDELRYNWYPVKLVHKYLHRLAGLKYFPRTRGDNSLEKCLTTKTSICTEQEYGVRAKNEHGNLTYVRLDIGKIEKAMIDKRFPLDYEVPFDDESEEGKSDE